MGHVFVHVKEDAAPARMKASMGKPLAVVALLALALGGAGSSALLTRAVAQPRPLSAVQHEKRLGPKPIPQWYWRWIHWRLHDRKGSRLEHRLRPNDAPHRIPHWAWRRFHFFLLARTARASADGHKDGVRTKPRTRTAPTPSESSSGSVYFHARANKMTQLYSVGIGNQGQSPSLWTCLCFTNNDISLASDSTYGQAYKATVPIGDTNPWGGALAAGDGAGQLSIRRSNDLGKWDWYALAIKVPSWSGALANIKFVDLLSMGYQTSAGDQVGLGLMNNNGTLAWQIHQNSGYANVTSGFATGSVSYKTPILPVSYGQWQEFAVGVKWATDNTGAVQVYSRTPGGSWQKLFEKLNQPTYLYGTTATGTFAQDGSNWPTVIDKIGLYYGEYSITPTETVYESGLTRSSDLATAQSTLP